MEITRKPDLQTVPGPEQYFTGKVTITGQFQRPEPSRVGGAIVHFEPGARTAWHSHPAGQTLIVTDGVGWTQIEGGSKLDTSKNRWRLTAGGDSLPVRDSGGRDGSTAGFL